MIIKGLGHNRHGLYVFRLTAIAIAASLTLTVAIGLPQTTGSNAMKPTRTKPISDEFAGVRHGRRRMDLAARLLVISLIESMTHDEIVTLDRALNDRHKRREIIASVLPDDLAGYTVAVFAATFGLNIRHHSDCDQACSLCQWFDDAASGAVSDLAWAYAIYGGPRIDIRQESDPIHVQARRDYAAIVANVNALRVSP